MEPLSDRQKKIFRSLVEEYIATAQPVGSENLEKKYAFGVSPATIRNEMASLTKDGFLEQPHSSAGRVPTAAGFRFYISNLMQEEKLSVREEVAAKERVWDWRHDFSRLLQETTRSLAQQTNCLAVSTSENGDIYHAGYSHILETPEFYDIDVTRTVLNMLDEFDELKNLLVATHGEEVVSVLLGQEMGDRLLEPCGVVYTRFETPRHKGSLGIIGPRRFHFSRVIPVVRYYGQLLNELLKDW